jgi:hypothetical protein
MKSLRTSPSVPFVVQQRLGTTLVQEWSKTQPWPLFALVQKRPAWCDTKNTFGMSMYSQQYTYPILFLNMDTHTHTVCFSKGRELRKYLNKYQVLKARPESLIYLLIFNQSYTSIWSSDSTVLRVIKLFKGQKLFWKYCKLFITEVFNWIETQTQSLVLDIEHSCSEMPLYYSTKWSCHQINTPVFPQVKTSLGGYRNYVVLQQVKTVLDRKHSLPITSPLNQACISVRCRF